MTAADNKALGQWIRRNEKATAEEIPQKLQQERGRSVYEWIVLCQLKGWDIEALYLMGL